MKQSELKRIRQIRSLASQLEYLVREILAECETGPESSREEMAPALSGGDKSMTRLIAASGSWMDV